MSRAVPTSLQTPIGILGGTFDPIHNGHLYIASQVLHELNLARIHFLPCYQPVHRPLPQASVTDRVTMIELALKPFSTFLLDEREIKRVEPSYMIDTLISLRAEYANTPLCLIMGADAYCQIALWKRWQELLSFSHLIVINRTDSVFSNHPDAFQKHITQEKQDLHRSLHGKIYQFKIQPCFVSATSVRKKVKQNEDIANLVPKNVAIYIKEKHLYC